METYISILRGINVSGQKLIKMSALKALYEELGLEMVQTYVQSGNVVFRSGKKDKTALQQRLSGQILSQFGFEVPVIVLQTEDLESVIKDNPYIGDQSRDSAYLHVTFLSSEPEQVDLDAINAKRSNGEEFALTSKAVYLYCPNGYGRTKLTNTFLENKLKVSATTRNWKTCQALLTMAEGAKNKP